MFCGLLVFLKSMRINFIYRKVRWGWWKGASILYSSFIWSLLTLVIGSMVMEPCWYLLGFPNVRWVHESVWFTLCQFWETKTSLWWLWNADFNGACYVLVQEGSPLFIHLIVCFLLPSVPKEVGFYFLLLDTSMPPWMVVLCFLLAC